MKKTVMTTHLPGIMKEFGEGDGVMYVDESQDSLSKSIKLIFDGSSALYGKKEGNLWRCMTGKRLQIHLKMF